MPSIRSSRLHSGAWVWDLHAPDTRDPIYIYAYPRQRKLDHLHGEMQSRARCPLVQTAATVEREDCRDPDCISPQKRSNFCWKRKSGLFCHLALNPGVPGPQRAWVWVLHAPGPDRHPGSDLYICLSPPTKIRPPSRRNAVKGTVSSRPDRRHGRTGGLPRPRLNFAAKAVKFLLGIRT